MSEKEENRSFARRNFFREGLREMFSPLADLLENRIKDMPDFSSLVRDSSREDFFLRPPGARGEEDFLARCIRCGSCRLACPFGAISMLRREDIARSGRGGSYSWRPYRETGTPCIVPSHEPCRMCEDFPCAAACPSGALVVPAGKAVIGCAAVNDDTCLRADGEDCRLCLDACPVGENAIGLRRKRDVQVLAEGCTGCGACEHACPTDPPSIRVYLPE